MIVNTIADQKNLGWASFASVSREWHTVIGKRNTHRLKLQAFCLDDFEHMVIRQRDLARHICVSIELPRYTCRYCHTMESKAAAVRNSDAMTWAIWMLFTMLSTWKPAGHLTLELNEMSASDLEHWFKRFHFDDAADQGDSPDISLTGSMGREWHDPRHGWVNGQQLQPPPFSAMQRLFELIDLQFRSELPRLDAVTCLMIRRQFRCFLRPSQLSHLLSNLAA